MLCLVLYYYLFDQFLGYGTVGKAKEEQCDRDGLKERDLNSNTDNQQTHKLQLTVIQDRKYSADYIAYLAVHSLAVASCWVLLVL